LSPSPGIPLLAALERYVLRNEPAPDRERLRRTRQVLFLVLMLAPSFVSFALVHAIFDIGPIGPIYIAIATLLVLTALPLLRATQRVDLATHWVLSIQLLLGLIYQLGGAGAAAPQGAWLAVLPGFALILVGTGAFWAWLALAGGTIGLVLMLTEWGALPHTAWLPRTAARYLSLDAALVAGALLVMTAFLVFLMEAERTRATREIAQAEQARRAAEQAHAMAAAEAERRAVADRRRTLYEIADRFEQSVGGIAVTVANAAGQLSTTAHRVAASAARTLTEARVVEGATERATDNVESVAAAGEELNASIREIARQVEAAAAVSRQASVEAGETSHQVAALTEASARIGDVVRMISQVASQTNLLALNATIEAARAGEAGKGFAVVANEVKSLANQTARATEEIAREIAAMRAAIDDAAGAMRGVAGTIERLNDINVSIAGSAEQQAVATGEISRNITTAAGSMVQVSAEIASVARNAAETEGATAEVHAASGALTQEAGRLRLELDRFLETVRVG